MNIKKKISLILLIGMTISLIGCGEKDHNDGKCDICGKTSTYSDGEEEYCDTHLKNAVEWYIEQGQN